MRGPTASSANSRPPITSWSMDSHDEPSLGDLAMAPFTPPTRIVPLES
jgi:hypothetical protein